MCIIIIIIIIMSKSLYIERQIYAENWQNAKTIYETVNQHVNHSESSGDPCLPSSAELLSATQIPTLHVVSNNIYGGNEKNDWNTPNHQVYSHLVHIRCILLQLANSVSYI